MNNIDISHIVHVLCANYAIYWCDGALDVAQEVHLMYYIHYFITGKCISEATEGVSESR